MRRDEPEATIPFPLSPISNGEWMPKGPTRRQFETMQRVAEAMDRQAKRHGMSRAQFLRTAAATATAFWVMNETGGLAKNGNAAMLPLRKEQCDDLDGARELLDRKMFIMDVQTHHADVATFGAAACFLRFVGRRECQDNPAILGQLNYIKEMLVDSQTTISVLSGLPYGVPQGPANIRATRDLINEIAGSERCISQAIVDPNTDNTASETHIGTLERQVNEYGARALKTYTYSYGGWRLDDEKIAFPLLQKAQDLGLGLVNTHKGLPAIFAPGSEQSVRTTDYVGALRAFPKLKFCAYHSGYFPPGEHPEGKVGVTEFIEQIALLTRRERRRMYAEIGSTYAIAMGRPAEEMAPAHLIGQLLLALGPKNILWGTDSIWWGSPQFMIDHLKALQIPEELQEQFGYPALTDKIKRQILGMNAARLYKVKVREKRCTIPQDQITQMQLAQGGFREGRSLQVYGARTRREFLRMFGPKGGANHFA
jgi:hypothetical protein